MHIRPETPADYAGIARVNALAFADSPLVYTIVDLHRHRPRFDAELSLVAENEGEIVGHVLFSPQTIRLMGQDVEVVNLSPLAVAPGFQRQGVGAALVREGHRVARLKGYPLSFLVGHPPYYPRFGYLTRAYGGASLKVNTANFPSGDLETRPLTEDDIPTLRELWRHEEGAVDFSIDPGSQLLDWISPNPAIKAQVYTQDGAVVGYARVSAHKVHYFLAADGETARHMAKQIGAEIVLPLHRNSASAAALVGDAPSEASGSAFDAAMVCPFAASAFEEYYAQVQAGKRLAGRPIWGVEFDLAE